VLRANSQPSKKAQKMKSNQAFDQSLRSARIVSLLLLSALLLTNCSGNGSELEAYSETPDVVEIQYAATVCERPEGLPMRPMLEGQDEVVYYFEKMNAALAESRELVEFLGFSQVTSCEQAHRYTLELQRRDFGEDFLDWPESTVLPSPEQEGTEQLTDKIWSGDEIPYGHENDGVVQIITDWSACGGGTKSCTATFISRWHILTAAHCFCQGGAQNINVKGYDHDTGSGVWDFLTHVGYYPTLWPVHTYIYPGYDPGEISTDMALVSFQLKINHAHDCSTLRQPTATQTIAPTQDRKFALARTVPSKLRGPSSTTSCELRTIARLGHGVATPESSRQRHLPGSPAAGQSTSGHM
jgi:hypothetical protein